jgi:hypothetical protein
MAKIFQESFDNFNLKDNKTSAYWNTLDGTLEASYETLGLTENIPVQTNTTVGPSILDDSRDLLYFIKYNQDPVPHISVARFDIIRKKFLSDIVLNTQDLISDLVLSPDYSTLFLLSTDFNRIRRINLNTGTETQNPVSINKPKKIVFHKPSNKAFIGADSLYEVSISTLISDLNPALLNYQLPESIDIALSNNFRDLVYISKLTFGLTNATYKLHHLDLLTNNLAETTLYTRPTNLLTALSPNKVIAVDSSAFILNNSFSNPQLVKVDLTTNTLSSVNIPISGIAQDTLLDIAFKNNNIFVSHGVPTPNTSPNSYNVIYSYSQNLILQSTIVLPLGAFGSNILVTENDLYAIPRQTSVSNISKLNIFRVSLADSQILQSIDLNTTTLIGSKPKLLKGYITFSNLINPSNNIFLLRENTLEINFGSGFQDLIIDGSDPNNCLLDGVLIPGGPFNLINPYILDQSDFQSIQLINGAIITYPNNLDGLILRCSKKIQVDSTSKIIANGLGQFGGRKGTTDQLSQLSIIPSAGRGLGSGQAGAQSSSGGSLGGLGGLGAGHSQIGSSILQVEGGRIYGDKLFKFL